MIKCPENAEGYSEAFDAPALQELAEMSKAYVIHGDLSHGVPSGRYSDFACGVWEIMNGLVRAGIRAAWKEPEN